MNDPDPSELDFPLVPVERAYPAQHRLHPVGLARRIPPPVRQAATGAALVLAAQGARWLLRRRARTADERRQELEPADAEWWISLTRITVHITEAGRSGRR